MAMRGPAVVDMRGPRESMQTHHQLIQLLDIVVEVRADAKAAGTLVDDNAIGAAGGNERRQLLGIRDRQRNNAGRFAGCAAAVDLGASTFFYAAAQVTCQVEYALGNRVD